MQTIGSPAKLPVLSFQISGLVIATELTASQRISNLGLLDQSDRKPAGLAFLIVSSGSATVVAEFGTLSVPF